MKPNCYDCKHRREVPGSAHSSCAAIDPLEGMAVVLGMLPNRLGVKGDPHGIAKGWFAWPISFDPVWLEECNGFERKEGESNMSETRIGELNSAVSPTNATNATKSTNAL